ncbi:MAG TPA: molybdate ABC transporter substrate-binding protein [Gammaproteobacteria bacterium]|nr:molybdate ABC transporter substrate-binding protein [Gammaproteobacteria bacterium]
MRREARNIRRAIGVGLAATTLLLATGRALADSATIAVAANFLAPLEALEPLFEEATGHELVLVAGSTGQLYAQIVNGAPFDVLLSADAEHAQRLVADGLAEAPTRFTYAVGRLALWTRDGERFAPLGVETLRRSDYRWLAIANPELAPYGLAAQQTLTKLGLWDSLQSRIVRGQSIAQTFAMAETRNADLGLVALSQVITYQDVAAYFEIPPELHAPLRQDAVLLARAHDNAAARAFVAWLRNTPGAAEVVASFGYAKP